MPVKGYDNKVILDFSYRTHHHLIGFGHYFKPKKLIGADVSSSSLEEARCRLEIHKIETELVRLDENSSKLLFEGDSIDHIHSSGVIPPYTKSRKSSK